MKILNVYPNTTFYKSLSTCRPCFTSAKDINLDYIYKNHFSSLPPRMQNVVERHVKSGSNNDMSLRDLHIQTYSKLENCESLDKAQNEYREFGDVLQFNAVLKHKSPNVKKIMQKIPLEDFSLYVLKERWLKLKTLDEIARDLGLKDRAAIAWFLDKIRMPDFGKNYIALLNASDEALNNAISQKVKNYNALHRDEIIEKNRRISAQTVDIQRDICQITWDRLPHIKEAFSEMSKRTNKYERCAIFWETYPEYAKEFAEMKKVVAAELRAERKKNKS